MPQTDPHQQFALYSRPEYLAELTRAAEQAGPGDDLTLMTMVFNPLVADVKPLMAALAAAAGRGAAVTLIIDAYSFMLSEADRPGPLLLRGRIDPARLVSPFRTMYSLLSA